MANEKFNQRGQKAGIGLPESTCANDLFTRLDDLEETDQKNMWGPVRAALGWVGPTTLDKWEDKSWVDNVVKAWWPKEDEGATLTLVKSILVSALLGIAWLGALFAEIWIVRMGGPGGCKAKGIKSVKADIQAKEFIGMLTSRSAEWATRIDYVAMDYLCPSKIVDLGTAVAAYMADSIDWQTLTDYCRANGFCTQVAQLQVAAQRGRPDWNSLAELRHRELIADVDWKDGARALGWTNEAAARQQFLLTYWYPDTGFTVQLWRGGSTNDDYVNRAGLDDEFADFWQGDTRRFLQGRGVQEGDAKFLLRSAYAAVDPATAGDLFRRWTANRLPPGENFTEKDFDAALHAAGIPPKYREMYKELAFQPLGFRQLKLLLDESIIDENQTLEYLVAGGFKPADAELLVKEWMKAKPAYVRRKIGAGSPATYGKAFADGLMGQQELARLLKLDGFTDDEVDQALQVATEERLRVHRQELIKFLKARYIKGEVNEAQVQSVLTSVGLGPEDVADLLRFWRIEFEVHPRQASTAELVAWYKQGIVSRAALVGYLAQLRYTQADAARIVASADFDAASDNLKRAEKLVAETAKGLSADVKSWRELLKQAEKLHGDVSQRTLTNPGKLLDWVSKRVIKKPKEVSAMLASGADPGDLEAVNGDQTEAFFTEPNPPAPPTGTPPA